MKWFLYYTAALVVNVGMTVLFKNRINIGSSSAAPLFLLILSLFMSVYFYTNRSKSDFSTNGNNIEFTEKEWNAVAIYISRSFALSIPLYITLFLFISPIIKAVLSSLVFLLSLVGSIFFYRIENRQALNSRFENEKKELEEQKKLEESGKWKR